MSRISAALGEFVESIIGALLMIVLAVVAFYITVFVVSTGGALAGQAPSGNFVVLSASLLVVAAILAGGLSPVTSVVARDEEEPEETAPAAPTGQVADEVEDTGGSFGDEPPEVSETVSDPPSHAPDAEEENLARFQLYRDAADEWRWRLVHRNGNIIATSGEGYSSDRAARRGMESVMDNAPGAEVQWDR